MSGLFLGNAMALLPVSAQGCGPALCACQHGSLGTSGQLPLDVGSSPNPDDLKTFNLTLSAKTVLVRAQDSHSLRD